jgi:NADH-quinone oxidoreductase subunit C
MFLTNIYLFNVLEYCNSRFLNSIVYKHSILVLLLNKFFYYNLFTDLKDCIVFKFKTLIDYTALHYFEKFTEFELNFFLISYDKCIRLLLKLFSKKEDLILSLYEIYLNSSWLEREVWDMFGIKFIYHKDLRRILTDYGFLGHPLLKHFPLSGFYELRFDEIYNKIIKELIELAQAFRFFLYINPWIKWHK